MEISRLFCTFAYVKRYFTILLCSLYALLGMAQNNMQVAHYSTKEGLPHDIVYCSLKSEDSFLWFGTWFGLSRFDGSRFANYSDAYISSSDQPPRKVEWLAEDALGNLWIKTLDWKLSVFFKQTERFEDVYEELKPYARNLQVIKIQADGTGKILLFTKDKNLLLAETLKDGNIRIQTLVDARSKNVYLLDMQGRVKQVFDYVHHQIGSIYHAMCDDRQNLWLSTKGDGLVKLTPDASRPIGYRIDHYRHDARDPYSISGNNVYMTCQDSYHRIWVATLDGGLNLLQEQGGKMRFYNKYHGMKNYPGYGLYMDARNLVEDSHQRMWVGTMDGLMSFKTDFKSVGDLRFETYRNTDINTRANSDIYGLYKDNSRQVWMCTFGGGLSRLDGFDEVTHLPILTSLGAKEGLHNDVIISILEDKMGRLWLVNADGLSCYDYQSDRIQHFDNSDGFPDVQLE